MQTSPLFLLFWRYLSSDFVLLFQISPNPPIPHLSILHSLSAQGTNLSHVKPLLFSNSSNPTPGLTNCKWVSNSPQGKGSYIYSSTITHYGFKFKRTLPPLVSIGHWPMAQSISIETTNIRSLKANDTNECRKKLKTLLTNKPEIAIITECHLTNKHIELMERNFR